MLYFPPSICFNSQYFCQSSRSWGLDEGLNQSRADLRTAHELGINILHFAWKRKQMLDLQAE
jgi:hypothetical protein